MSASRERAWLALCVALQAAVFAGSALAASRGAPPSAVVWGIALAFVPHVGVLAFSRRLDAPRPSIVSLLTFALGAIWLLAPPVLSDDLYRYIWEGRLWLDGINPYRVAPDDPSLAPLRDEIWASINNKPIASVYPPLSQLLFAIAASLGGGVVTVKLLALFGLALTAAWVARLSGDSRAALAVGLNPLLSSESALNGHFDVLVGAALLTVAWSLSRQRFARAGLAVVIAVGLKAVGLVVLPLLWRRPKAFLGAAFASALLLAPLAASRMLADPASGPGQFATRWRGNESIFALVDWLARLGLPDDVAGLVSRLAVAAILVGVAAIVVGRRVPAITATRSLIWAVLLLSPQVHPWYLGWLLPLELAARGRAGLVWSAAVLLAYAPIDQWMADRVWEMSAWIQIVEYSLVGLALAYDFRCNSKQLR